MTMPSLSPTMEQGALSQWMKKVGDAIAPGETIAVIQTDKAAIDLQATDDAFLAKTFVVDGAEVRWREGGGAQRVRCAEGGRV
jgi:pyruvate/2-oxoglutarate dehydrogenase complex dihydrolipoamide acyltransferase (E2) component